MIGFANLLVFQVFFEGNVVIVGRGLEGHMPPDFSALIVQRFSLASFLIIFIINRVECQWCLVNWIKRIIIFFLLGVEHFSILLIFTRFLA
jgi:hypothetical protein